MKIICYDKQRSIFASIAALKMFQFGHPEVYVLSGGFAKWNSEKRPVCVTVKVEGSVDYNMVQDFPVLSLEEFDELVGKVESGQSDVQIIDMRPDNEKRPEKQLIKGAIRIPYSDFLDEYNALYTREEIETYFKDMEIDLTAPIVLFDQGSFYSTLIYQFLCKEMELKDVKFLELGYE